MNTIRMIPLCLKSGINLDIGSSVNLARCGKTSFITPHLDLRAQNKNRPQKDIRSLCNPMPGISAVRVLIRLPHREP